jgi:hypothetical protein
MSTLAKIMFTLGGAVAGALVATFRNDISKGCQAAAKAAKTKSKKEKEKEKETPDAE